MKDREFDNEAEARSRLSRQDVERRTEEPGAATPNRAGESLLRLQRLYGNRYVQRVLAQAKQDEGDAEVSPEVEAAIRRKRGGGQALDSGVRAQMEPAFGADFGGVRVHADAESDALSRELNAQAFTTGQDVFFRQGAYDPGSSGSRELLAHELTHVVQQEGDEIRHKLTTSTPGDRYEQEADQVARAVIQQEQRAKPTEADQGLIHRQAVPPPAPAVVQITIQRDTETANSTTGTLTVGANNLFSLELPWRGNAATNNSATASRIPAGTYTAHVRTDAGGANWRLELEGTAPRTNIQIHAGNVPADSTGCILPGTTRGVDVVNNSVAARNLIQQEVNNAGPGATIRVTIIDPPAPPAPGPAPAP